MPDVLADDGCRIAYEVGGAPDGPALLLSNALGTTRDLWKAQRPAFARAWRVVAYDARGHGASAVPPDEATIERLGRDALAVLDAAGVDRASVCGISIGGLTALWLGVHAPHRVRRLVLANTAARIGTLDHWQERIDLVRSRGLAEVAAAAPARWFTEAFRREHPDEVAGVQAMLSRCDPEGYAACAAALRDGDLREEVARVGAPALVIAGRLDPATTQADADWLCAHLVSARRVDLEAAHLTNVERAEEFTSAVMAFLAELACPN
jgi:3-oxoadipate enol-lactonase